MADYKICIGMFGVQDICGGDCRQIIEVSKIADSCGIDSLTFTDHVIMSENTGVYPFGDFPVPPEYPWFEPLTTMAVIAGATHNIRLATGVLIAPLRPAALLAKIAATFDVLSGGRLDLGIGTGWQKEEYIACGLPFDKRMRRLDDQVRAMRQLWSGYPVTVQSETVSFENLYSLPQPLQKGGVPLWYGVKPSAENIARISELGDGWVPIQSRPEFIAPVVKKLRQSFVEAGRDADQLRVRAVAPPALNSSGHPDLDRVEAVIEPLLEAGATHIEFMPYMYVQKQDEFAGFFERLAAL